MSSQLVISIEINRSGSPRLHAYECKTITPLQSSVVGVVVFFFFSF